MNRVDIANMAKEAGLTDSIRVCPSGTDVWIKDGYWGEELEYFAALVAAAEREECAKVCEEMRTYGDPVKGWLKDCAAAIRARGEA